MFFNKKKKSVEHFLESAENLGLRNEDAINAKELIQNGDYKLGFEIIVEQLYEYDIEITDKFYILTKSVAEKVNIHENEFSFLKDLIRK